MPPPMNIDQIFHDCANMWVILITAKKKYQQYISPIRAVVTGI